MLHVAVPARFEIVRFLGEGGTGIVYEARDKRDGTHVALKALRSSSPGAIDRLRREFEVLHDVRHANLVKLGELLTERGAWLFTMELIPGTDFLGYVREGATARLREDRLRRSLGQLALGLESLHASGLVHRDIKPSNIRVTPEGRVVLLDFGLVAEAGLVRGAGLPQAVGTPAYMAPEQALGDEIGPEADWYSVGVILYEALTGVLPFSGGPVEVLESKQAREPVAPRAIEPAVAPDLDALCVALLRFDPRARPSARRVLRVASGPGSEASPSPDTGFVGRAEELEQLGAAYAAARRGAAVAVLITGEPGVGKSALVRQLLIRVESADPDPLVLTARCRERDTEPFNALAAVVDALARALARLPESALGELLPAETPALAAMFPVLQRRLAPIAPIVREPLSALEPLELRARAFGALRALFGRLAARRPLVVAIHDGRWVDADSRSLLAELLREPDAPPLLLVVTMDSSPAEPVVVSPLPGGARRIDLERLSKDDTLTLAEQLLEATARRGARDATMLAAEAAGDPLLLDALVRRGALGVESLEGMARRIVDTLAVAGGSLREEVLACAAGAEDAELAKHVAILRGAHVLRRATGRDDDRIELYHARLRAEAVARSSPSEVTAIHERLAHAFNTVHASADPEAISAHSFEAGDRNQAARFAALAADRAAQSFAFHRAASLYERALTGPEPSTEQGRRLHVKLGDALACAGRWSDAAKAFGVAVAGASAAEGLELRYRAAEGLLRAGFFEEGIAAVRELLASIGMRLPESPRAAFARMVTRRLLLRLRGLRFRERDVSELSARDLVRIDVCYAATLALSAIDNLRASAFQAEHTMLAVRAGEPFRAARALALEAGFTSNRGGEVWPYTEGLLARAQALAERSGRREAVGLALAVSGIAHYLAGKLLRATELLVQGHRLLRECPRMRTEAAVAAENLINCLAHRGMLRELSSLSSLYLREATDRGDIYGSVALRTGYANVRWLALDQPVEARAQITLGMRQWSKLRYLGLISRANIELYEGEGEAAHAQVEEEWRALGRSLLPASLQAVRIMSQWTRGRCALAAAERVPPQSEGARTKLEIAARAARALDEEGWAWSFPLAALLRAAHAARRARDPDEVRRLLERAVAGFDAVAMELHAAAARRRLGELLGGDEGHRLIEGADAWMRAQTIRSPARMARMIAPGFG